MSTSPRGPGAEEPAVGDRDPWRSPWENPGTGTHPQQPYTQQPHPSQPYPSGGGPSGDPSAHWASPAAGWGTAPAPPPRRRRGRAVLVVLLVLAALAVIVVALLAFAVGPRFARVDVLDRASVERGVTQIVSRDWQRRIDGVRCPDDQEIRPGTTFTCSAGVDGRPQQVPVEIVDATGLYQVGQPR